mmetsp:Transcript_11431/g.47876  ORF Transcript_11431/g.47876 Transcript_11431/m.47876 type:complete len:235 (-) Transcript_11431:100-804(-)
MLAKELEQPTPRRLRLSRVEPRKSLRLFPRVPVGVRRGQVVHERVPDVRVRVKLAVAPGGSQVGEELFRGVRVGEAGEVVQLAEVRLHGHGDLVRLADGRVWGAVEGRRAHDVVGVLRGDEGERSAHAETHDAHLRGPRRAEILGALDELVFGVGPIEGSHEVVRLLDVHAELALVQVRDDAAEAAVLAELERLTLDVLGDPPPLLYDDHGGRRLVAALVARDLGVAEGDLLHG